ncbi:hypothetical protein [Microbacterium panaciterrae]|uniref:hypothetical protein n=1 Tax=Microbacterium panaciterrae TaxID=985759 RepID=UPI0031ED20CD
MSEMSGLGSFADDVLMDTIRVESGRLDASKSPALTYAHRLFHAAVDADRDENASISLPSNTLLSRLASLDAVSEFAPPGNDGFDVRNWFEKLTSALDEVLAGDKADSLRYVEREFSRLAETTLVAARDVTEGQLPVHRWSE